MSMRRAIPAGLVDAGFSSLATFILGLYVANFDAAVVGAYAIYFSALQLIQSIPTYLILTPLEVEAVSLPSARRLSIFASSGRLGAPIALASATLTFGAHFLLPEDLGWAISGPLAVSTSAAAFISPLQDHVRRTYHLAERSWSAVVVAATQLAVAVGSILILPRLGVPPIWIPMGGLALANLISTGVGLFLRRGDQHSRGEPFSLRAVTQSGSWLIGSSIVRTGGGLVAASLIANLASLDDLGFAEAARILSQPILVLATGLGLVFRPRSMEAAQRGDETAARRISTLANGLLFGAGVITILLVGIPWEWSPLPNLLPNAYAIAGLIGLRLLANVVSGFAFPFRFEVIGARLEARLARTDAAGAFGQVVAALTAPVTQAFAHPLGAITASILQIVGYRRSLRTQYWRRLRGKTTRVLQLARDSFGEGGAPTNLRSLAEAQSRHGLDVTIAGFAKAHLDQPEMFPRIEAVYLPNWGWRRTVRELAGRHDIVHIHGMLLWRHAAFFRLVRNTGVSVVVTPRSSHHPWTYKRRFGRNQIAPFHFLAKRLFTTLVDRPALQSVHGIHVLSPFEAEFESARNVPVWVHPYGIDAEAAAREPRTEGVTTFLFVGRLDVYQKGLDLLIDAFRQALMNSPEASLIIAGPGDPGVLAVDGLPNVAVLGEIDHDKRRELMARADFFVHPSRWEVMARSARESLAAGLPLIATRESNFGDWVAEYDMGIVAAATAEGVAIALCEAIATDETRRQELRKNAATFAAEHPWSKLAEELERRYNEILK